MGVNTRNVRGAVLSSQADARAWACAREYPAGVRVMWPRCTHDLTVLSLVVLPRLSSAQVSSWMVVQ